MILEPLPKGVDMAAYVIAMYGEVTDQDKFNEYRRQVPHTLEIYGGKYIVRGGATERVEGDWNPNRMVIIQFETMGQAKRWYNSKEYSGPMRLRHESANAYLLFVEGV